MTDAQKCRMRLVRTHMDYITAEINDVDKMIQNMISSNPNFENAVQFLCTIPGVKRDSAITIISEIGTDMSQFSSSKRLWFSNSIALQKVACLRQLIQVHQFMAFLYFFSHYSPILFLNLQFPKCY